jgi:hypothetical protein
VRQPLHGVDDYCPHSFFVQEGKILKPINFEQGNNPLVENDPHRNSVDGIKLSDDRQQEKETFWKRTMTEQQISNPITGAAKKRTRRL